MLNDIYSKIVSRELGKLYVVAGTTYRSASPKYAAIETAPGIRTFKKVVPGIPFVRA